MLPFALILAIVTTALAWIPVPNDFLDHYKGPKQSKNMWKTSKYSGVTGVKVTDRAGPWPLDEPPWEFVPRLVRDYCTNASACWFRDLQVPATVVLHDDSLPVRTNVSVMIEGVWHPWHYCCTREIITQQLAHVLRLQHDSKRTEYLQYEALDRQTNQTTTQWRAIFHAPKGILLTRGFRKIEQHFWLGVMINVPGTTRSWPIDQCKRTYEHVRPKLKWSLEHDYLQHHALGLIRCIWPNWDHEPPFIEPYQSVAEQVLKGSLVEWRNPWKNDP
ncbi:hypothetical protein CDD82_4527 [Ophiocordyceps australis]|uniref:Peptidase M12A domain-containing protein n=1 Tax=Ophiocordyceps australis TaxID=1399860 RepID=A0A2C5Z796_9HYPO|nr:hypothetical protein CDD82_4527 [Ophiocordyceps australis]